MKGAESGDIRPESAVLYFSETLSVGVRSGQLGSVPIKFPTQTCPSVSAPCYKKAQNTLIELNLNSNFLARFRSGTIKVLRKRMEDYITRDGLSPDKAIDRVMAETFNPSIPTWPPFFSTIRAIFGVAAEKRLKEIGYGHLSSTSTATS